MIVDSYELTKKYAADEELFPTRTNHQCPIPKSIIKARSIVPLKGMGRPFPPLWDTIIIDL
jgi:hypothetical protein